MNVDKDEIREKLKQVGAVLVKPEVLMQRTVFNLPEGHHKEKAWARVRDEGDKITMSFKVVNVGGIGPIDAQKEICLKIDNYNNGIEFLRMLGCQKKAQQESKREIWQMGETEVCIDEWPFLEPFVEIEGQSEAVVKEVAEKLGFDYSKAMFCSVDTVYARKYGVSEDFINNRVEKIFFDMENPFTK